MDRELLRGVGSAKYFGMEDGEGVDFFDHEENVSPTLYRSV